MQCLCTNDLFFCWQQNMFLLLPKEILLSLLVTITHWEVLAEIAFTLSSWPSVPARALTWTSSELSVLNDRLRIVQYKLCDVFLVFSWPIKIFLPFFTVSSFLFTHCYMILYILFYRVEKQSICKAGKHKHIETNVDEQQHYFFLEYGKLYKLLRNLSQTQSILD